MIGTQWLGSKILSKNFWLSFNQKLSDTLALCRQPVDSRGSKRTVSCSEHLRSIRWQHRPGIAWHLKIFQPIAFEIPAPISSRRERKRERERDRVGRRQQRKVWSAFGSQPHPGEQWAFLFGIGKLKNWKIKILMTCPRFILILQLHQRTNIVLDTKSVHGVGAVGVRELEQCSNWKLCKVVVKFVRGIQK